MHRKTKHELSQSNCGSFFFPMEISEAIFRRHTCSLPFQSVPNVAVEVVVSSQQQASALGEGHGSDATDDVVVAVHHQLLVSTQVKQPAGGVIGACAKCIPVGEKLEEGKAMI